MELVRQRQQHRNADCGTECFSGQWQSGHGQCRQHRPCPGPGHVYDLGNRDRFLLRPGLSRTEAFFSNNWNAGNASTHEISGNVTLNGTVTFAANSNVGVARITTLSGVVGGTGNLLKNNNHTLVLSNTNTYTGSTRLSGTVVAEADGALGTAASGTTLFSDAVLEFDLPGDYTVDEALRLGEGSTVRNVGSDTDLASTSITLMGDASIESVTAGTEFSSAANIDLAVSNLTTTGDGDICLTGAITSAPVTMVDPITGIRYTAGLEQIVYDTKQHGESVWGETTRWIA